MLKVIYEHGLNQEIASATFMLDNHRYLKLTTSDTTEMLGDYELVTGQVIKISIKDEMFGTDEMSVELDVHNAGDMIRVLQRLSRQVSDFKPEVTLPEEDDR